VLLTILKAMKSADEMRNAKASLSCKLATALEEVSRLKDILDKAGIPSDGTHVAAAPVAHDDASLHYHPGADEVSYTPEDGRSTIVASPAKSSGGAGMGMETSPMEVRSGVVARHLAWGQAGGRPRGGNTPNPATPSPGNTSASYAHVGVGYAV
jgi:hypothetical protein